MASLSGENTSPVFRVNSENILLYSNSAGLIFLNHFNSKQGEKIPKPFLEILNQAGTKEEVNKIEVKQDNETFEFDIVYVTEMNYFNIYGHNITKRKIAENNIILAKNVAEKANHAKTEFLTHISHELRTPMNAILGFTDLMSRDSINPLPIHQKDKLDQVTSSGKHLLKLINEMLDLSAVESGNLKILIEATDLIPIVDDVISTCQALAFKNGIILEHEKFSSDQIIVDVDSNRMKQVILNLISNAIKYNKPNGKVIVSYLKQKNSQIRLGIKDSGYGISEENKKKIFKPFQRLDVGGKNIEGSGIGLTISKQLIELMSGKIGFESTRDKGSYFYIDLQLSNNTLPKKEIINSIKLQTDNVKTSDFKKILYIEDNEVNIKLVGHILSLRKNIIYLSTTKAMAGIELAKSELPELILLDLRLPDMDGITAFKELKSIKETANIPVIALSANAIDGEAEKALTIGFKNYITKPLDIEKFLNIIDKVLV